MSTESTSRRARATGREWLVLSGVFVVGLLLLLSRTANAISNPQFYVEDGREWYAQAHELGSLRALAIPHRGYLVLVQRLGAMLALAFPLRWGPIAMALFGAALDVLPAVLVASSRFARVVPSLPGRLFLAFLCLAAPNAWTLMSNTAHSMWYLGLLACLVVLAETPARWPWRVFDLCAVLVSGLSGPFAIMLAPVAALKWWFRRERWTLVLLLTSAATALVQVTSLLRAPESTQGRMALGADAPKFAKLLVKRVIYEALFGQVGGVKILNHAWGDLWTRAAVLGLVGLVGAAVLVYALARAPLELRLLIVFAGLTFLAAIAFPGASPAGELWWDLLIAAGNGNRYFFMPVVAFLFTCAWMATAKPLAARVAGASLLAVAVAVGIPLNWREPPYQNYDFPAAVRRYDAARAGERIVIMTPPDWRMVITKKAGEPVVVEPDECTGEEPVAASLLASNQMAWHGNVGRSEGGDPYAIFGLASRRNVCGVRVTFTMMTRENAPALLQMFWADGAERDISADERNGFVLVTPGPAPQTAVFHVRDTIDHIRLDPGSAPGTVFELEGVVLLTDAR